MQKILGVSFAGESLFDKVSNFGDKMGILYGKKVTNYKVFRKSSFIEKFFVFELFYEIFHSYSPINYETDAAIFRQFVDFDCLKVKKRKVNEGVRKVVICLVVEQNTGVSVSL